MNGASGKLSALACGTRPAKSRFPAGMTNEKERAAVWVGWGRREHAPGEIRGDLRLKPQATKLGLPRSEDKCGGLSTTRWRASVEMTETFRLQDLVGVCYGMGAMTRAGSWVAGVVMACAAAGAARGQPGGGEAAKPIATFATGWTYLWADQGANYRANLNGWFVRGTVNLARGYGVFFSSTNYYGTNAKGSVNSHGYTLGVTKEVLARARVKCSVFGEAGDVRASSAGTITNELLIATGVGVTIPVSRWVSVVVTPAEYVFVYPHGDWRNDYNGKLGLSFPIGRR